MRRIAVLDAPSNLGLRPPTAGSVPGCAKAPGALRDHGLVSRLAARDAGCVTPPRYDPGDWRPGDGVAHAERIAWYSRRLSDRIGGLLEAGEFPVVLGGDCSILLGSALATNRLTSHLDGRVGLVYVDGHSDFRHPGNASYVGAAAGEDLALVTGRGQDDLTDLEGRRPYFRDSDVVVLGIRTHDEHRADLHAAGIAHRAVPQLRAEGAARSAQWARRLLGNCLGYWVHLDVDVLDPAVMPAVDAPDPGGIAYAELELLLAGLVATPHCLGVEVTVFDPDYDPTGAHAAELVGSLVAGLAPAATVAPLDWDAVAPVVPASIAPAPVVPAPIAPAPLPRSPDEPPLAPAVVDDAAIGDTAQGPPPVTVASQRSPLDRMNLAGAIDADRAALARRRVRGVPLRRESPDRTESATPGAPAPPAETA
jgi:arginase